MLLVSLGYPVSLGCLWAVLCLRAVFGRVSRSKLLLLLLLVVLFVVQYWRCNRLMYTLSMRLIIQVAMEIRQSNESRSDEEKMLKAQNLTESILGGKRNYELRLS
jgi:hypothetical protein